MCIQLILYTTSLKLAAAEIWRLFRGRADAENRIKELKYDFGFDSVNLKDFYATEAALTFAMIAYNLMALFRTFLLQEKTQRTLSTLRFRTFAIGACFDKLKGKLVLKIALSRKDGAGLVVFGIIQRSLSILLKLLLRNLGLKN